MTDAATITPGAPSSTHSFIVRQAGVPGERFMLAGVVESMGGGPGHRF
jgi:hypothetical protein